MDYAQNLDYYVKSTRLYNSCMDALAKVYTRWFGSALSLRHYDVERLYNLVLEKKTSITKYCHELNDKIFFAMYKTHLYKDCQGKDVNLYVL